MRAAEKLGRGIQGLGAGCLIPVAQTIIGDVYTLERRAKIQALLSGVIAIATIIGPYVGGAITEALSWRWIFYVNVPASALVAVLALVSLHRRTPLLAARPRFDWIGVLTFTLGAALLLYAFDTGGIEHPWLSVQVAFPIAAGALLLGIFPLVERRAVDPMFPVQLLRQRDLRGAAATSAVLGVTLYAAIIFLPLFVQFVLHGTPTASGQTLVPLMVGTVIASALAGRLGLSIGFRPIVLVGMLATAAGFVLLLRIDEHTSRAALSGDTAILGLGSGLIVVTAIMIAQKAGSMDMGVATASVNFSRQMGGALGVAIGGGVIAHVMTTSADSARRVLSGAAPASPSQAQGIAGSLTHALHVAFAVSLGFAVLGIVVAIVMLPRRSGGDGLPTNEDADSMAPSNAVPVVEG